MTLLLQPFPEKVRGAQNLYLIYSSVWIYVPTLNRKVSDLRPGFSQERAPQHLVLETSLHQEELLLVSLCAAQPPRIHTCRGI